MGNKDKYECLMSKKNYFLNLLKYDLKNMIWDI